MGSWSYFGCPCMRRESRNKAPLGHSWRRDEWRLPTVAYSSGQHRSADLCRRAQRLTSCGASISGWRNFRCRRPAPLHDADERDAMSVRLRQEQREEWHAPPGHRGGRNWKAAGVRAAAFKMRQRALLAGANSKRHPDWTGAVLHLSKHERRNV